MGTKIMNTLFPLLRVFVPCAITHFLTNVLNSILISKILPKNHELTRLTS